MHDNNINNVKTNKSGCFFKGIILLIVLFAIVLISAITLFGIVSHFSKKLKLSDKPLSSRNSFSAVYHSGNSKSKNKIALVNIKGLITDTDISWSQTVNSENICDKLNLISRDKNVKAVILNINSPGGEITAVDKIYHYVQILRKKNIPVVSILGSLAASGGYYLAAGSDIIIANRLTITGSIGVIINNIKYYDLLKKIGVDDDIYKSGKMKDILNPARPTNKSEKIIVQNLVMESYDEFVNIVSKGRIAKNSNLTVEYIKTSVIGDGRIFSGKQALKLGLVDYLGYFNDSVQTACKLAKINKNDYQIITYDENLNFSDFIKRLIYKNTSINIDIPTINRLCKIDSGKLYYIYPGWLQ
ncbi:MAG TPA: signal peptide peptidase SppA [Victivallales bacterium]|nr:signal peptide peptidase SppA [Victivallales bacterium]